MSRSPAKLKSIMNRMSQAGRDQPSGDQIMVPNVVTRSRKIWLRIPTAQSPQRAGKDGHVHLRQRQIRKASVASSSVQIGRQTSECVRLRCQVTISIGSFEKNSRRTSESGKIEPSITDQVITRLLSTGSGGKRSLPLNTALAMSAPAMP